VPFNTPKDTIQPEPARSHGHPEGPFNTQRGRFNRVVVEVALHAVPLSIPKGDDSTRYGVRLWATARLAFNTQRGRFNPAAPSGETRPEGLSIPKGDDSTVDHGAGAPGIRRRLSIPKGDDSTLQSRPPSFNTQRGRFNLRPPPGTPGLRRLSIPKGDDSTLSENQKRRFCACFGSRVAPICSKIGHIRVTLPGYLRESRLTIPFPRRGHSMSL
jgi:hypothetical protein